MILPNPETDRETLITSITDRQVKTTKTINRGGDMAIRTMSIMDMATVTGTRAVINCCIQN
jgi:hypothetical protein